MLHTKIKELQEENFKLTTTNPVLNAFSLDKCAEIDQAADKDKFIAQQRNKIIDKYLKKCSVGHSVDLKQALDEYYEILTYLYLDNRGKNQGFSVKRMTPIKNNNTPDFEVDFHREKFYIEMKTLGFNDSNNNYIKAANEGLDAKVSQIEQIHYGEKIAISEVVVSPFRKENKGYEYNKLLQTIIIDSIITKLDNKLIKEGQFAKGKTVLLVNLSLYMLPQSWQLNSVPIYQEKLYKSMVSGILWYSAFGKLHERIFTTIKGEGSKNIEGELSTEGILNKYEFVKAVCFQIEDEDRNLKLVGFYRENDKDEIYHLIYPICDFVNNDYNTHGYEILQP